jgi:REP element-mobilizing transposase RayT
MSEPHAYLLTWTTYGTWLPGDQRGSVDGLHNVYGEEFAPADNRRRAANAAKLSWPPFRLDHAARPVVREAITEHCGFRGWELVSLNVRSNHVHIVVRSDLPPDATASKLKARATRVLRERGVVPLDRPVWTERGSGRYLWNEAAVEAAARYVEEGQGEDLEQCPIRARAIVRAQANVRARAIVRARAGARGMFVAARPCHAPRFRSGSDYDSIMLVPLGL